MTIDLSIIVPLYNEEESVGQLHEALVAALAPLDLVWEIVLVDDGSRDGTLARSEEIARSDLHVRVLKLRRNSGQTAAMAAGIEHAHGEVLITMDGDLQNDPADIPSFVDKLGEGYDLVVGWRQNRQDKYLTRILPSKIANWLIGKVTGVPIRDNGCSLKAYRASVIKRIPLYAEMHRFIPAMSSMAATRIAEIPVRHHPRRYGSSKYGLSRTYKVLLDLLAIKTILLFGRKPAVWFGGAAAVTGAVSVLCLVAAAISGLSAERVTTVFSGVGVLLGALSMFLLFLGLLNHLIHKTGARTLESFVTLTSGGDAAPHLKEV